MILVTGGAGFIGSVLVKELNRRGKKNLVIVDRLRNAEKWKNLRHAFFEDFIHADDFFQNDQDDLLSQLTAIFHIGACSSTTQTDADYLMGNNYSFSKNIFDIATHYDIPLVYASSAATYGDGALGYDDDHQLASKLIPLNPYGFSKKIFDDWALAQKGMPSKWFGLKFFNVYGPNEYHKEDMRSLVHKAFGQIKKNGKVQLFKSHRPDFKHGEQLRDFVYVVDVVNAMIELMEKGQRRDSGLYNLGTGKARSFVDLVTSVFRALNLSPKIDFIDMPESIRHQYQYFTEAKMQKLLNVLPEIKFSNVEDGVADYVKNYLVKDDPYFK